MLPLLVAGPAMVKVTGNPEVAVADSVIGGTPYVTGDAGAGKAIVWAAKLTVKLWITIGAIA